MKAEGLEISENISEQAEAWKEAGRVVVYAGWDGQVMGLVGLGETVRAEAKDVLHQCALTLIKLAALNAVERRDCEIDFFPACPLRADRELGQPAHVTHVARGESHVLPRKCFACGRSGHARALTKAN